MQSFQGLPERYNPPKPFVKIIISSSNFADAHFARSNKSTKLFKISFFAAKQSPPQVALNALSAA